MRTDFAPRLRDLGVSVDPLAIFELVDQMRVGRQEHRQRVSKLLGAPDRLSALREEQGSERVPQVIRARDWIESYRTAGRPEPVKLGETPRV